MKIRNATALLLLGALASLAAGCAMADAGWSVRMQDEIEGLRQEVSTLKKAQQAARPATPGLPGAAPQEGRNFQEDLLALRQDLAGLSNSLDGMRSDLRAVGTRVDEGWVKTKKENRDLADRVDKVEGNDRAVQPRLSKIDEVDKRLTSIEERLEKVLSSSRAQPHGPSAAVSAPGTDWKTPEDMYDSAYGSLIKGAEPAKSRAILDAFLGKYPTHKLAPNAYYWRGETFYLEKDHESAIVAFQDVIDKFPASEKAPDALFKQGLSFLSLNDRKNAKTLMELLLSKYPKSPAADKARQKLAEIK